MLFVEKFSNNHTIVTRCNRAPTKPATRHTFLIRDENDVFSSNKNMNIRYNTLHFSFIKMMTYALMKNEKKYIINNTLSYITF